MYPDTPVTVWWAHLVTRIVLVSTPNRGVSLEDAPAILRRLTGFIIRRGPGGRFWNDLLSGSVLLTDLKIRRIHHFRSFGPDLPQVVNLVPAKSMRFWDRYWMIDLVQFPGAQYLDVPGATNRDLVLANQWVEDAARLTLSTSAVFGTLALGNPPAARGQDSGRVVRVVFILHGIRASNTGWVSQLSGLVRELYPASVVVTATYGYNSALRFPFALARCSNVRWFQDLYSYNFSKYPGAEFYFIGHSLGTYILGRSMAGVSAIRFKRIVLIGSVLPHEYRWSKRIDSGQVDEIRNDRSSRDFPVKVMCSALHAFGRDARDWRSGWVR